MNFKAKMKVEGLTHYPDYPGVDEAISITMVPITSEDTKENKTFSKYTPSGNITLYITNPNLFGIKQGDIYLVDITKV